MKIGQKYIVYKNVNLFKKQTGLRKITYENK